MLKEAVFYVIVPGETDKFVWEEDAQLTERGKEQVRRSARKNLVGIEFDGLYCAAGYPVTDEVIKTILSILPESVRKMKINSKYCWHTLQENWPERFPVSIKNKRKAAVERGGREMRSDWGHTKMIIAYRQSIGDNLRSIIEQYTAGKELTLGEQVHFLISCLPWSQELLADEKDMPILGQAEVLKHLMTVPEPEMRVDCSKCKMISSESLDSGASLTDFAIPKVNMVKFNIKHLFHRLAWHLGWYFSL